ncbi:FAD/NAD(P)-binding domain-containing protein [Athelia psychrophila]|uniref:FAD/NAD(P)-binding domain-containing protein n=1 Tax=Athelia psychrophila TaxID=1759441 RepID=A0A166AI89_9AGAM|nr:FAD/NAD(P)-binding domain-containing protein [Fibularhizoctonia sp. CBS 109695]
MTTTSSPRIAIIGAGLGGLSLLTHLQRHGITATVYEKDSSFDERSHIGSILDIHYESGQRALNEANIAWKHLTLPEGEETRMYDSKGTLLHEDHGHRGMYLLLGDLNVDTNKHSSQGPPVPPGAEDEHSRPEIDRTVLRKLFYDYVVTSDSIRWSHSLRSAHRLPDGTYELAFANGATTTCDLLVGADGTWSKVRPLVSSEKPAFRGITGAETSLAPATIASSDEMQEVSKNIGQGTSFALQGGDALISQRQGDGRIRTYAWFHAEESFTLPTTDVAATRAILLSRYENWNPWLRKLISECDPAGIYLRPLYALSTGHKWDSVPGVTLIGDAAHLMSPFAGEGANLALLDGLELALALAGAKESGKWQEAVGVFEREMCDRAAGFAAEAAANMKLFLGEDSPDSAVKFFSSMGELGQ